MEAININQIEQTKAFSNCSNELKKKIFLTRKNRLFLQYNLELFKNKNYFHVSLCELGQLVLKELLSTNKH